MWCRALLAAIALTYVICVLLLSGLQKGDLDASVLEKLQRRNVNIDDINKEFIREKCTTVSETETTKERPTPTTEELVSTIRISKEHSPQESVTISTINTDERNNSKENLNRMVLENIINMYRDMINKTKIISTTSEPTKVKPPVTLRENTKDYSTNNLKYINDMLLSYIASKFTTTVQPSTQETTTSKLHIDTISQKIEELLEQTRYKAVTKHFETTTLANLKEPKNDNKLTQNIALELIDEYLKKKTIELDDTKEHNKQTKPKEAETNNTKTESKLTDEVINQITEKVRASVLKDLQAHISAFITDTTTTEIMPTTLAINITNIQRRSDTTNSSNVLEHIIELLQQLKLDKDSTNSSYALTQKKNAKNEFHGPINVVYSPPLVPVNFDNDPNNLTVSPKHVIAYPYNHFAIINNPTVQRYNPRNEMSTIKANFVGVSALNFGSVQPINVKTIQSEVGEIPPLLVKMPNTISQNIIVTTNRPFEYGKNTDITKTDFYEADTGSNFHDMSRNNDIRDKLNQEDIFDREPKFVPRNRYGNYGEYDQGDNILQGLGKRYRTGRDHRDYNRFHELLERTDGYSNIQHKSVKPKPRLKVPSRQQQALHDLNSQSFDDTHFRNFLKSQQKVNDMLEKILATKSDNRGVEIL